MKNDFKVYYTAARLVKEGKIEYLYDDKAFEDKSNKIITVKNSQSTFLRYINLPAAALIFIPFSYLSVVNAYKLYSLFTIIVLLISIYILKNIYKSDIGLFLICIITPAFYSGIYYGQLSSIVFLLFSLILYFLAKKKDIIVGLLSGLLIIKPQFVLLIPFIYLYSKNKKIFSITSIITITLYLALNVFLYGGNFFDQYISYLYSHQLETNDGYLFNFFIFTKYLDIKFIFTFCLSMLFIFFVWFYKKSKESVLPEIILPVAVILCLILNIHTTFADLVFLLFPMALFYSLKNPKLRLVSLVLFFVIILLAVKGFYVLTVLLLFFTAFLFIYKVENII